MTTVSPAVDYIRTIANSSLARARTKVERLNWGIEQLLQEQHETNALDKYVSVGFIACAMGIAELAACSPKESVLDKNHPEDMDAPKLTSWRARVLVTRCPLKSVKHGSCQYTDFHNAADAVAHINDTHSKNWTECKSNLREYARIEEAAIRADIKKNPHAVTITFGDEELTIRFKTNTKAQEFVFNIEEDHFGF